MGAPEALRWALYLAALSVAMAQGSVQFGADGRRTLVQLTDLHFGEGADKDAASLQLIERVLAAEKPGLAIFSGDMVSGFAYPAADLPARMSRLAAAAAGGGLAASSWYGQQLQRLVAPLLSAGVPWASILGNHDGEADLSRRQIAEVDAASGGHLSLTRPGPQHLTAGGAYWIDVLEPATEPAPSSSSSGPADGGSARVAARIWMLDSGNRGCGRLAWGWGCVPAETVEWVRQQAARLPPVPSLAFIHIPLPQHSLAWNQGAANGSKAEWVGCPGVDTGFFHLAREIGIGAIYSGHDHNNDFCATLDGVRLAYGRKSGFGSYGPRSSSGAPLLRGARVVELRMGQGAGESDTWIRQQDGSKQQQAQAAQPKDRPLRQHMCNLDESGCDRVLGPKACLTLRQARNCAALLATLTAAAATLAVTALTVAAVARRGQQHLRCQQRSWQRVSSKDSLAHASV